MVDGSTPPTLGIKLNTPHAKLPSRGSPGAAGYDLYAANPEPIIIQGQSGRALVPTGIQVVLPPGTYGRVAPRSGLAVKKGISVGAGVIDIDYTGEIGVLIINHGDDDFTVAAGERVAQLILERIMTPEVVELDAVSDTQRGSGGFGSTGVH
jgi:dUTP pyrophosphatase